jgi:HSP20 family protein
MTTTLATYRPGLLGRNVFDDLFEAMDFPSLMSRTTQGYPVADMYQNDGGDTVMEFALAGFSKEDLNIEIKPENNTITVSAAHEGTGENKRRIARRSFTKTYVNYDNNLNLNNTTAEFSNGLLTLVLPRREETKPLNIKIN